MTPRIRRDDDDLPLSPPVLYVLLALADEARHGYAIMQEVEERTAGRVRLLPGSLYATIKRMLHAGLVREHPSPADDPDPRRKYYAITEAGRELAAAEIERLSTLVEVAVDKDLVARRPAEAD